MRILRDKKKKKKDNTNVTRTTGSSFFGSTGILFLLFFFLFFNFLQLYCPNGISPMGNSGCFPRGKPAAKESRYPTHSACWVFSIIRRTLTWTTGPSTCAQMLMHAIAHGGVRTHVRECALKGDSGRKIPCRTEESNQRQRRDGLMPEPAEPPHPHSQKCLWVPTDRMAE